MAKAYDRMEWPFLRNMMLALGFVVEWVDLVLLCVTTVSYNIQKAQAEGSIHGCRVARGASPISHMFFADDSLLFFKANSLEAGMIKHCLEVYEGMSCQAVNYHKSSICFSRNTTESAREEVAGVLGVVQAANFGRYLGLPNFVGRNKRAVLHILKTRLDRESAHGTRDYYHRLVLKEEYIGRPGIAYVCLRSLGAWVSRNSVLSIWQCWENKPGVF
ncbi:uncharacterized protein LOC116016046 [Ipomoea triloba]|uniref:uncharacterized protein LOC116016046 n=1 Tax=Ipomoea triloba TaxID=35885 RepID=UPI00125DEEEF|nr:uncharacterized protein LOC116016046 [Ipomoea triloba]